MINAVISVAVGKDLVIRVCSGRNQHDFKAIIFVDIAEIAKKHFEKSVRKTLTIPAWLNATALEQGINFSQTLQEALLAKIKAH